MPKRRPRRVALDLRGLGGREDIFRLSGANRRDPVVAQWFAEGAAELRAIARAWFDRMRACGDDVLELLHDGCPVACVEDAAFGYVNAFKDHVNVGFFYGAMLEDRGRLLQGSGKRMRHVKLRRGSNVDAVALGDLIDAAYADIKARLDAHRS
jgi:hypothetical protein